MGAPADLAPTARATEVFIRSIGVQGDGMTEDGSFVAGALPGERVRARPAGAGRAELLDVLEPSPERRTPPCPHFGACGGCALQHWADGAALAWKVEVVRRALARERLEAEILAPWAAPPGSRRRLALHARRGPAGPVVGFKARRSWRLEPIAVCTVAEPGLVAALPGLRAVAGPMLSHPKSAPTLHATLTETGVEVEATGLERRSGALSGDALAQIAAAAAAADFARVSIGGEVVYQARAPVVRVGRATVALPPGAFLQAVAEAEAAMGEFVSTSLAGARRTADLYCGVGAFAFRLAEQAQVRACDVSAPAVQALLAARATAPGLKPVAAEVRDLERRPVTAAELKGVEAVVVDPPRSGAPAQHAELARSGVERIAGVSCNPATFARDARILVDGGFRLTRVLPVDQFLWSPHVELVGVFERSGR